MFLSDFEDALYDFCAEVVPNTTIVFAHGNGPEKKTPFITLQTLDSAMIGRQQKSSLATNDQIVITTVHEVTVAITFYGKRDIRSAVKDTLRVARDLSGDFHRNLTASVIWTEVLDKYALSYMRGSSVKPIQIKYDTDWYEGYRMNVTFAFSVSSTEALDTIEQIELSGILTHEDGTSLDIPSTTIP